MRLDTPKGRPKTRPTHRFASRLLTFFARRFVAGETLDDAIRAARELNARGIRASLDYLGEEVHDAAAAAAALEEYMRLLDAIAESKVDANISIKLTQLGLAMGQDLARRNLIVLLERAKRHRLWVRIDMEGSAYTQSTLEVFYAALGTHDNVGIVIQSYLKRSEQDVAELVKRKARVRLCKGAYDEPAEVAFRDKAKVNANYDALAQTLLEHGFQAAIATHDDARIDKVKAFVDASGIGKERFEFQMLYGLRRRLWSKLVNDGWNLRVYVPYGDAWMPYMLRRLRERRENWIFVLRSLWRG